MFNFIYDLITRHRLTHHHLKHILAWVSVDIGILSAAYLAAFSARAATTPLAPFVRSFAFVLFAMAVMICFLYLFGIYHRIWSQTSGQNVALILNAVVFATLVVSMVNASIKPRYPLPLSVILVGDALAFGGFVGARYRSRLISGTMWRWKAVWFNEFPGGLRWTRVLIVGAGESGRTVAINLQNWNALHNQRYNIVGIVDDDPKKHGMYIESTRVLGACADIPAVVTLYEIDLIIIAIHNITGPDFRRILGYCEQTKVLIKVAPDMFDFMRIQAGAPLLRDLKPEDYLGRKPIGRHEAVDFSPIQHKVVLVTGAAGSIGSELSRQLLDCQPTRLILLDSNESGLHDLLVEIRTQAVQAHIQLIPFLGDVTNPRSLTRLFESHPPHVIFHAAAYKHVPMLEDYPDEAVRVNIGGTLNLTEMACRYHAERFVLISSDKAVNPQGIMGATKRVCELVTLAMAEKCPTLFTAVRFGNVLGSRGSIIPTWTRQIEVGGPVTVTDPAMKRYFMSIPEAVNLVLHAACLTHGNDLFMLQMGELIRIIELAERIIRMRGLRPHEDIPIEIIGIRAGEKLHEQLHDVTEVLRETVHPNIMKLEKAVNGFHPVEFVRQIQALVANGFQDSANALDELRALIATSPHEVET